MQLVVNGVGTTLVQKVTNLYNVNHITIPLATFLDNIILYGMAIYILARLMYGIFDINFLLGKYFEQFLKDLARSRFCAVLPFFTDPTSPVFGYTQYFK